MYTDWNNNGKQDWTDDYMDYHLCTGSDSSGGHGHVPTGSSGGLRVPTWLMVVIILGIVSGQLPINSFTTLLAIALAVVVLLRLIQ